MLAQSRGLFGWQKETGARRKVRLAPVRFHCSWERISP